MTNEYKITIKQEALRPLIEAISDKITKLQKQIQEESVYLEIMEGGTEEDRKKQTERIDAQMELCDIADQLFELPF